MPMAEVLDQLVDKLTKALGPDLISTVLYGSAAVGDRDEAYSDYNVLCVLAKITPEQLGATEPIFRWWREKGNPAPLLLTEDEFRGSSDCFPMEFHDIREHHKILQGADVVSGISVEYVHYRAQIEHELRAKLLRLRQKASGILSDKEVLRRLLADSVSTFCVLFRHALVATGGSSPGQKREIIGRAREAFGIEAAPFELLLDVREGKSAAKIEDPEALLARYMAEIGKVIGIVDRLAVDGGGRGN